jgi:cytochrome c biogenesis protein CcmG, thiol:disulfide interchange protein DsbE
MRNLKWISAALILSSLTIFLGVATVASDLKQPMIGEPAPAFVLKSLDGKTVSLQEQRGKFVVLHIAASW